MLRRKLAVLVAVALLVCLGLPATAQNPEAASTVGLTNVVVTTGQEGGFWFYDFALVNNTSSSTPLNDGLINYVVLIDRMVVDQTNLLPEPAFVTTADGWKWSNKGWERNVATPNEKYNVGPSVGPDGTLRDSATNTR